MPLFWGCGGVKFFFAYCGRCVSIYTPALNKFFLVHGPGRSLRDQFFFLLRTALKDHPKGPSTANSRQLPTATNHRQPPAATNRQLPTTANRHQPPTTNHQPITAANHHQPPPTASCQLPTANRHQPWLSTWSARGIFWENWYRNTFSFLFFSVQDRPDMDPLTNGRGCGSELWVPWVAALRLACVG